MFHDEIRSTFVAEVETLKSAFTDYAVLVEYDNRIVVDPARQTLPFLCVEVVVTDSWQADMSNKPIRRYVGFFILTAKVKVGEGTRQQSQLLEHFYKSLDRRKIGPSHIFTATFDGKNRKVGNWTGISALLPFQADDFG